MFCQETHIGKRNERGQSLIVALVVLFALFFLGTIFVALVAHNLQNAGRARNLSVAEKLAEAGIRYCDYNLTNSNDGADWRPPYQSLAQLYPGNPVLQNGDPDAIWISQGFSRINFPGGRALVRVSYHPDPTKPLGRFIKIESIGRVGTINPNDPTIFTMPPDRLRQDLVAYKQIGLGDYLFYVTNLYNDSRFQAIFGSGILSVPLMQQLGELPIRTDQNNPPGAPIRVNGDMRLIGNLDIQEPANQNQNVQVAGQIHVAQGATATINGNTILPSTDPNFSTYGGLIRDSSTLPDISGYTRSVSRTPPPTIDTPNPATGVPRYRALTRDSGRWMQRTNGTYFNTGSYGYGRGVYIPNWSDRQNQTVNGGIPGNYSLRADWLNPQWNPLGYWDGPFYKPPGAYIDLGIVTDSQGNLTSGFTITRDDAPFTDPAGRLPSQRSLVYSLFIYRSPTAPANSPPELKIENPLLRGFLQQQGITGDALDAAMPDFNGVIYAEGNIRIRGLLPSRARLSLRGAATAADRTLVQMPSLTVVSGSNIYIEGNLVRDLNGNNGHPSRTCLGLLAVNYVCVNTTMFMAPQAETGGWGSDGLDDTPPHHVRIGLSNDARFNSYGLQFSFGDDPTQYTPVNGGTQTIYLLLRHCAAPPGPSYLNLMINPALATASGNELYPFNVIQPPWIYTYPLVNPATQVFNVFEKQAFNLFQPTPANSQYTLLTQPGLLNTLDFQVDQQYAAAAGNSAGVTDYLLGGAGVEPLDIRIDALIYAQDGSFFVIPGYWFNPDPNDVRNGPNPVGETRPPGTNPLYPFYGDPLDVRITVVGSITENTTASAADQSAWMNKWGWIPATYGSSGVSVPKEHLDVSDVGISATTDLRTPAEQSDNITRGLLYIYDPVLAEPYETLNPNGGQPIRPDPNNPNLALPPVPKLPVAPGLLYFGRSD